MMKTYEITNVLRLKHQECSPVEESGIQTWEFRWTTLRHNDAPQGDAHDDTKFNTISIRFFYIFKEFVLSFASVIMLSRKI
jgi:hypothetical protein